MPRHNETERAVGESKSCFEFVIEVMGKSHVYKRPLLLMKQQSLFLSYLCSRAQFPSGSVILDILFVLFQIGEHVSTSSLEVAHCWTHLFTSDVCSFGEFRNLPQSPDVAYHVYFSSFSFSFFPRPYACSISLCCHLSQQKYL